MAAIRNLVLFIIAGGLLFLLFGWYSGFFAPAEVHIKTIDAFIGVYEDHRGEYSETIHIQDRLADKLWEDGVDNYKNFGIYYDDPEAVEPHQLHSMAGRVVAGIHEQKIQKLTKKYNLFVFEQQKAAMVELPVKNIFSLYAGVYKAYPLLEEFAEKKGFEFRPVIEIYDNPGSVQFIMPLD